MIIYNNQLIKQNRQTMYKNIYTNKKRNNSFVQKPYTQRTGNFLMKPQQQQSQTIPINYDENIFLQDQKCYLQFTDQNYSQRKTNKYMRQDKQLLQKLKMVKPSLVIQQKKHLCNSRDYNYEYLMFQKKLQKIIQRKVEELVQKYCQRYFLKFKEAQSLTIIDLIRDVQKQFKGKIHKIQTNYDRIIETYDNFLSIVETIKDHSTKPDKYFKKKEFDSFVQKYEEDLSSMGHKIATLSHYLEENIKIQQFSTPNNQSMEMPYILDSQRQTQTEQLKTIVSIYNQNFLKIQKKLTLLFSCI